MSLILWKNIHLCIPKFKCLPTNPSPPPVNDSDDDDHITDQNNKNQNPVLIIKNFNSIYNDTTTTSNDNYSASVSTSTGSTSNNLFSSSDDSSEDDCIPDFSAIFASRRFFFSSPGNSNSIIDHSSPATAEEGVSGGGVVAVQTYSPDPYGDFRRSMQEMVEAEELRDLKLKANWDYLNELLLCYLSLNPKHTHKLIISAFTDLIVSLNASSSAHRKTDVDKHRCATSSRHLLA